MRFGRLTHPVCRSTRSIGDLVGGAFRVFLYANIFLALCAATWAYSTYRVLGDSPESSNPWLLVFITAGVLVIYTVDRIFTFEAYDPETASERHRWIACHRSALIKLLGCAAGGTVLALPFLNARVLVLAAAAGLLALAYTLPVRKGLTVGLKRFGLLKIFLIAGVWAVVTTVLPPLDAGDTLLSRDIGMLFVERFVFVFAITLPFDIRDRSHDLASDILTIPVRFGTRRSKQLVAGAVAFFFLLKVAHYGILSPLTLVPAAVSALYVVLLLAMLSEARHDYYYSLLWDGAILVQALLSLVFARQGGA